MPLSVVTYHRKWPSFSKPALVTCTDGIQWVLKGSQNQRALVNEQVVARLGLAIGAPVCEIELLELTQALRDIEPELTEVACGLGHGVKFVPDCTDRQAINHTGEDYNKKRFAALQILYTWAHAGDNQLIYAVQPPHLVYSVDHGHFFPGGPNWTIEQLSSCGPITTLDPMFDACGIEIETLKSYSEVVQGIDDVSLRAIVDVSPDSWGINAAERDALFEFLLRRKKELVDFVSKL